MIEYERNWWITVVPNFIIWKPFMELRGSLFQKWSMCLIGRVVEEVLV